MKYLLIFFFLSLSLNTFAQDRVIKGRVTDDTNVPLQGVSVIPKGAKTGVQTDKDGNFSISIPGTGSITLNLSSSGYKPVSIDADGKIILTITMVKNVTSLDDVVVVGYQTMRRRDLLSSVSSVGARDLKDIPVNSAAQALAGRLAGVQVTGTEGSPDAAAVIRVRGGGSITQDNSPLYIIDGIQVEDALNVISPQDIASVDVLKDASATAIYGARGANGVIIITTKNGRNQKPTLTYNGMVGVSQLANKLDVMNPYDFVMYQYERSRGSTTDMNGFQNTYGIYKDLDLYKSVPFVDWQDQMFGRNAFQQTHNVALMGGNASTTYNLSLTYNAQDGILLGSDFDRKLVNFKLDHKLNEMVRIGFNTRYNYTTVHGAGTSNPGSSSTNRLRHSIKYRPFLMGGQDLYYYDDDYADATNANSLQLVNPILYNDAEYRRNLTDVLNLAGEVELKFTSYLSFKSTAGFDFTNMRREAVDDSITGNSKQNGGLPLAAISTSNRTTINNSNVLTFSNATLSGNFNKKNRIVALIGHEIYQNRTRGENLFARNFPSGIPPRKALGNMNLGTMYLNPSNPPSFEYTNRIVSFFGRINYDYDGKYLLTVSTRADGSSKFAEGNKWDYFPSVAAAWRVSKEKFMKNSSSVISDLKFRVSYGEAGNNRIGDFLYLTQFVTNSQYWLNDQLNTAYIPDALANQNIIWEKTKSRNIGLDISFLKNRIQLTTDIYKNTTENLLINVPVPTSSGYTTQIQNVGSTENRGIEIQINATPIAKKDFTWTANFNISFNKNEVTALSTYQNSYLQASGWGIASTAADFIVKVGEPVGSIRGFTTDGYYEIEDFDYNSSTGTYTLKAGQPSNLSVTSLAPYPGRLKFKDMDGNGTIDDADRTIIGVAQPDFFGGVNQQFTYKNFDLSIFVNFQGGNKVINANRLEFTNAYTPNSNMLTVMNDRWRNVNDQGQVVTDPTELAKINANAKIWSPSTAANSFMLHSWAVEDGSFIRINNVSLGYNFPKSMLEKIKIQKLRLYVTGNNLAVFTNYSGYDPEVSTRRSNPVTPGVDYSAYPRSTTYIAGVNVTF